ncbi:MAG TPA: extracellular solute-binding protein [Candidatus Sulfotelmatobacter sp.]|jgi:microcin C transport system substrate-binding protein|nr:extracellular solute-binding protein [Candidatus Sulfotelmatobacter sp.]
MKALAAGLALGLCLATAVAAAQPEGGIAMHGQPKYANGFDHFDYVNPSAPKGGELHEASLGNFDSFNPFIVKGQAAPIGQTFETLMVESADEPFSEYGLIAESVEVPPERNWVVFNLRPQARFHDNSPITADDVLFSFDILRTKGSPNYRAYYQNVVKAEKLADRKVRFTFAAGDNRELPLILGQLPVLSKKYWQGRKFEETTMDPPLGSGPYKVESFEAGKRLTLVRVKDYWGKDLPVNKGLYNFDKIRIDFYRDSTVSLEAFKAGEYDFRPENESKKWATEYNFPAVASGQVKVRKFENQRPTGMQGFVFNLRRPQFQDDRVRQALTYAFDFEWSNKNLFYGQYDRTNSFFSNSDLASAGLPSADELKILEPLRGKIPDAVFTQTYQAPATDGSDTGIRPNLRTATQLLKDAGWEVKDGKLVKDGKPFSFEILLDQPVWERIALPFVQNLQRLGIAATVRTVDSAQYINRLNSFDYDMIVHVWGESESPGNEQREFWSSATADQPGSANMAGIKSAAVDNLIETLVAAPDREALVARTRALDRVLLQTHIVIPHWHIGYDRVAYWDKFGIPDVVPRRGVVFDAWWIDPAKAAALAKGK